MKDIGYGSHNFNRFLLSKLHTCKVSSDNKLTCRYTTIDYILLSLSAPFCTYTITHLYHNSLIFAARQFRFCMNVNLEMPSPIPPWLIATTRNFLLVALAHAYQQDFSVPRIWQNCKIFDSGQNHFLQSNKNNQEYHVTLLWQKLWSDISSTGNFMK